MALLGSDYAEQQVKYTLKSFSVPFTGEQYSEGYSLAFENRRPKLEYCKCGHKRSVHAQDGVCCWDDCKQYRAQKPR